MYYCTDLQKKHNMESLFFGNSGLVDVAISNKLNQTEQRLLLLILGLSNKEGICSVPMAWLSGALHLARPNVSRVIKGLVSQNVVTRLDKGNRGLGAKSYVFRYNPNPETYAFNARQEPQNDVSGNIPAPTVVSPYKKQIEDLEKKYEAEKAERKAAAMDVAKARKALDEKDTQIKEQERQLRQQKEEFQTSISKLNQEVQELRAELNKPWLQKITDSVRRFFSKSKGKS